MQIANRNNADEVPRAALLNKLKASGISSDAYSVFDIPQDESLCIQETSDGIVIYYLERGIRTQEKFFLRESDACKYFFEHITSWFKQ